MEWSMRQLFSRALRGYVRAGRGIGGIVGAVAGALALSMLVVYPLWALATGNRPVYNLLVLAIVIASIAAAVVRALVNRHRSGRERPGGPQQRRSRAGRRFIGALAVILSCYLIAALYWNGILVAAIPATIALVILVGYLLGITPRRTGRDT